MSRAGPLVLLLLSLGCVAGCSSPARPPRPEAQPPRPVCEACGGSAAGGKTWADGRRACSDCAAAAVVLPSEAGRARATALEALQQLFRIDLSRVACRVTLLDRPELLRLAGDVAHSELRAFTEVEDIYQGNELVLREQRIFLLRGLPREEAIAVLAHELFHVWQVRNGGGKGATPAWREGSAQWVQLRVFESRGAKRWAERLRADPDPVYGEGLRRFEKLVKARGEAEALRLAATTTGFPAGF